MFGFVDVTEEMVVDAGQISPSGHRGRVWGATPPAVKHAVQRSVAHAAGGYLRKHLPACFV